MSSAALSTCRSDDRVGTAGHRRSVAILPFRSAERFGGAKREIVFRHAGFLKRGFYYRVSRFSSGEFHKFRVRSLVGLIPMLGVEIIREDESTYLTNFMSNLNWFIKNRPDLAGHACHTETRNGVRCHVLSIVDSAQLARIVARLFDPEEFLSSNGIRSLSKFHEQTPFAFADNEVRYTPGDADVNIKGGNSNWRGPVWFPTSYLILESLVKFADAFRDTELAGADLKNPEFLEQGATRIRDMAGEIANRMIGIFRRDGDGNRPVFGESKEFQENPHWRDCLTFNEFFHGDTGAGLGASHQTGWTGLVANMIDEWRRKTPAK